MPTEEEEAAAMREIGEALSTSIGSNEVVVTQKLGKAGYVEWKRRDDDLQEAAVRGAIFDASFKKHNADLVELQGRYVGAKATFWMALTVAALTATLCGVVEFVRVVAGA